MTTSKASNVHAMALKGNFDDCQDLVKAMFNHVGFRDQVRLSGVNSINWARIMAQIVYYFTSAVSLGAPDRKVSFTVPTGNFGDIFAGYCAKRMGLPIAKLVIATNENDILARTMRTGRYEMRGVSPTTSPSMRTCASLTLCSRARITLGYPRSLPCRPVPCGSCWPDDQGLHIQR